MIEEVVHTNLQCKPLTKERIMQSVSTRTLVLMVLLLFSVVAHQYVDWTPAVSAEAVWLAGDDPNGTDDPPPEIS